MLARVVGTARLTTPGGGVHGPSHWPRASLDTRGSTVQIPAVRKGLCLGLKPPAGPSRLVICTGFLSPSACHPHQPCTPDPSTCKKGSDRGLPLQAPPGSCLIPLGVNQEGLEGRWPLNTWMVPILTALGCLSLYLGLVLKLLFTHSIHAFSYSPIHSCIHLAIMSCTAATCQAWC